MNNCKTDTCQYNKLGLCIRIVEESAEGALMDL